MRNAAVLTALFALLFISCGCTGSGTQRNLDAWGWGGLAGLVLMTVLLILSVGYMASVVLNDEKMRAWVKKEVGQAAFSIIIFGIVMMVAGSLDPMLKSASTAMMSQEWTAYVGQVCCTPGTQNCMASGNRACHIEIASDYLQVMYETLRQDALAYLSNYWTYGFLSNLSLNMSFLLDEKTAGLDFVPFAGLSMPADYFSILFEFCAKLMMLVRAQQIFLDYIWYIIFPVFLSMGLILRMLYFTRKLGGLLIAIALCTYVVFPMFYVVSGAILFNFTGGAGANWPAFGNTFSGNLPYTEGAVDWGAASTSKDYVRSGPKINIDLCTPEGGTSTQQTLQESLQKSFTLKWASYENGGFFSQVGHFFTNGFTNGVAGVLGSPSSAFGLDGPIYSLSMIVVFALILPFLALMTTLASVKVLSPLLGGDVEISVLSRLI